MPDQLAYTVEPMTLADLDQVMEIERVAFASPWSARAYRYELDRNEHNAFLVVRESSDLNNRPRKLLHRFHLLKPGKVLGYAGCWLLVDECHVSTIAVHPDWRGQGLGELLLVSLLERGIELGAIRATLEVRVSNQTAQSLYHRCGFEIVSLRRRYYADNEDAYIMATPHFESPEYQATLLGCRQRLHARQRTALSRPEAPSDGQTARQNH
jgi:ribosomal-protein-alanine N-acetyltransferase